MKLVYVVDDDEAVRDFLFQFLSSLAGYNVEVFELAWAALDRCRAQRPDCIVSDVRMLHGSWTASSSRKS